MKKFTLFLLLCTLYHALPAQVVEPEEDLKKRNVDTVDGWKVDGVASINLAQVSFNNWAAGGINSISLNGLSSVHANYKQGNAIWENSLDLGYGILNQGKGGNKSTLKTDDKIDFSSKYGHKANRTLYYAVLLNFKSQFDDGYDYEVDSTNKISAFMAPAYLIAAIGLDYKPNNHFSAFIAPLTCKMTIVNDKKLSEASAYGVDSAKTFRQEVGGYAKLSYQQEVMENVKLQSKLDLFSNYLNNPQNIDISWEVLISLKVNKYISANISTHLLYDDDIDIAIDKDSDGVIDENGPRIQFKELIGVGLSVKF